MIYKKDYFGFVYKWINKRNGKYYIGSHHGSVDDGYVGSGIYFSRAYANESKNFERDILKYIEIDDKDETLRSEQFFLDNYYGIGDKSLSYNISKNAGGGWQLYGKSENEVKEIYQKISSSVKKKSKEIKKRVAKTLKENPNIKIEAAKKQKETKANWSKEKKKDMIDKMMETRRKNPEIDIKAREKRKRTIENRTEEDILRIKNNHKKARNSMSEETKLNRIEKQKETKKKKTKKEWLEISDKYKETMSKKSEEEIKSIRMRQVESFKNRSIEEKQKSERKRLISRNKNLNIGRNISEGIRKAKERKQKSTGENL